MTSIKHLSALLVLLAITSVAYHASAESHKGHDHGKADAKKTAPASETSMTNAEVRKVDKDTKKITLKHEAIKSLDMPGMTMVFQVKDVALLEKIQAGDKVKFKAVQEGNAYVVTELQAANQ
jgi:Cu(I)/Ag(I) efflux system periplasmic protein CusF